MLNVDLNSADLKEFKDAVDEVVVAMAAIKAAQEQIKDITSVWKERGVAPKTTKAVAKLVYELSLEEERSEKNALFDLTEQVLSV